MSRDYFRSFALPSAMAIQSDGKIVVAGSAHPRADFALARFNPDGTLDPTFGKGQTSFAVTGGGALFQLGPQVTSNQQVNIGIQSVAASKLGDKDACHIAYIDTKYADANEVARQRADERAAAFNCAKDMPEIFSSLGGSATDYASGMPCPGGPYREE